MRTSIKHSILRSTALLAGAGLALFALPQLGCSSRGAEPSASDGTSSGPGSAGSSAASDQVGSVGVALTVPGDGNISTVTWTVTGPLSDGGTGVVQTGSVNVANSLNVSFMIANLAPASGYTITLSGTSSTGTVCQGSATFAITARATTYVTDLLQCTVAQSDGGMAVVNAPLYNCAVLNSATASPTEAAVNTPIALSATAAGPNPAALSYAWSAPSGTFSAPNSANTNFTCTTPGQVTLTLTVGDGPVPDGGACTGETTTVQVTCDAFAPSSLIISSTSYVNTTGAIASLTPGVTLLANKADAGVLATTPNDLVNVWLNEKVDGSFGVTSPITLTDINPSSLQVINTINVPSSQVVTSFPSKSELGLHYVVDSSGAAHLVFVGYAGAGVGALDVSNSDAVPGQDPSNPVTFAFGSSYAFARTIVNMDSQANFTYTPTVAYGGNNGRSALLGSNGLYYAVGNANNGSAKTFGTLPDGGAPGNGTNPDVTLTTGLEVVSPLNATTSNVSIPAGNSAEVNPYLEFTFNDGGTFDKPGKDDNFRGLTEYNGALYFTKGSGSNGIQTVYTVPTLPTVASAASQSISVVPGFPTDPATTGGNFTPFAVFFANPTTMYVTDEGTGNSTDLNSHGGLTKWSLVNGTWQLDYVLTNGLIGTVDANVGAADAGGYLAADGAPESAWPSVTTIGLRNMTGVVNQAAGTVTIWAVTSTSSTSGDNGADPNKVVVITDQISATTLPASESFSVVAGPTYGTCYRGVAFTGN
jgi:hypothetical protein